MKKSLWNLDKISRSKTMLLLFGLIMLLFLFPVSTLSADENEGMDIEGYVEAMQPGWNLGNTYDAVGEDETAWGNPRVTKELIEQIAAQGFKSIRVPITFDERMEEYGDFEIDADFLGRVNQTVEWALEEDLYVMINIHHDSWVWLEAGMQSDYDHSLARYNAIWNQLADYFKDHSDKVMFESINEPRFWGAEEERFEYLSTLNSSFYEIVRNSGGRNDDRPLVLPTMDTGSEPEKLDALYDEIVALDDPNVISTVHFYGFWPFSVNVAGFTTFDQETKQDIIDTFDRVHDKFVANGIPVVLGEFGLLGFDTNTGVIQQGEKLKFFEFMIHYANETRITHMLWDNGQHFDRTNFEWADEELYQMMKASWETRSSTAESNYIYLKKDNEIVDVDMPLNLHGNQFVSLRYDGEELDQDQDYQLNGDILTINASLLADIAFSGQLETNGVLTATFNNGADWFFKVNTYDTPFQESTEGLASNFSIPTTFNGDQLATMEAVDGDGIPTGPQNWTTFKEFGYAFSPSYDTNEITFPQSFFNEVADGEVALRFHFWSGEILEYTLLKDGNNITGTVVEEVDDTTPPGEDVVKVTPQVDSENKGTILDEDVQKVNANGELVVNANEITQLELSSDQVKILKGKEVTVIFEKETVSVSIPSEYFTEGNEMTITLEEVQESYNVPSNVNIRAGIFKFTISDGENEMNTFEGVPVTLAFQIDSSNLTESENLAVYILNESTGEWEKQDGGSYSDGVFTYQASHFSTFTAMEESDDTSTPPGNGEPEDGSANELEELYEIITELAERIEELENKTEVENLALEIENLEQEILELESKYQALENKTSELAELIDKLKSELESLKELLANAESADSNDDGTETPASGTSDNEEKDSYGSGATDQEMKSGAILPDTATNTFTFLMIGLVLLIIGGAIGGVYFKKRKVIDSI
ncbi:cellulase family glycosylhydrolase [Salipaludibacillus sp. HK11]|uniref:cellulase family glycosylhydrolase n=1 Tax=Salipaludibacillus sp. HK11 TaxID=3394320 RepID=UPI0039FD17EB